MRQRFHAFQVEKAEFALLVPLILCFGIVVTTARSETVIRPQESPFNRSTSAVAAVSAVQWVIEILPGTKIDLVAKILGATVIKEYSNDQTVFLLQFPSEHISVDAIKIRAAPLAGIVTIEPQIRQMFFPRALPKDPLWATEWYLKNTADPGIDLNMAKVWATRVGSPPVPVDGRGVAVGVVDVGFDYLHPDLKARFKKNLSFDAFGNPLDAPNPSIAVSCDANPKFCHGTAVAGIIGATRNNGVGGLGVAPQISLADLRLIYAANTDSEQANTETYLSSKIAIKNNSWGPCDSLGHYIPTSPGNFVYDEAHFSCTAPSVDRMLPVSPGAALKASLFQLTQAGGPARGGLGTILTWSAGNGAEPVDQAHGVSDPSYHFAGDWGGFDGWACNRFVIGVGAIDSNGLLSAFSEGSPCLMVVAPGSGIVTTDLRGAGNGYNTVASPDGDYTIAAAPGSLNPASFAGTSAAAPMVAGVAALMLQVNPALSYRDVMHILVQTAKHINPHDPSWSKNAAGRWINPNYGFGLVDAFAAITAAGSWTAVAAPSTATTGQRCNNIAMTHSATGTSFGFNVTNRIKIEHVEILVGVTHPNPGDLQVKITDPSGKTSIILGVPQANRREADLFYLFTTSHFWDELSPGLWMVTVTDTTLGPLGVFNCANLNFYGTSY